MSATTPCIAAASAITIRRRQRLLAGFRDAIALLPLLAVATALATAWLLLRTAWGRDDVRDLDGAVALAIIAAAPAAWAAWLAVALITDHATPGQRAYGLRLSGDALAAAPWLPYLTWRRRVALWLAFHPVVGVVGWAWMAGLAVLAGAFLAAVLCATVAAAVALSGVASLAMILVTPDVGALHDRATGMKVVAA